jgi:mannose-6-phosphate isomerase-like protein (cupin superfamily)
MADHIVSPSVVKAAGNKPKIIEEFIGLVNTKDVDVSIARMKSPGGWIEPGQTPDFSEYTMVLNGTVRVHTKTKTIDVKAGEAIVVHKGEWVRYGTPYDGGAEYVSVCLPAFSPSTVHRDTDSLEEQAKS